MKDFLCGLALYIAVSAVGCVLFIALMSWLDPNNTLGNNGCWDSAAQGYDC